MGTLSGFGTASFLRPPFQEGNEPSATAAGDPWSLRRATVRWIVPSKWDPFGKGPSGRFRSASNRRSSLVRDIALWSTPRCSRHRRRREIRRRLITVFATCWLNFAMQRSCLSRESPIRPETPKPHAGPEITQAPIWQANYLAVLALGARRILTASELSLLI